jgi:hypothetical protein
LKKMLASLEKAAKDDDFEQVREVLKQAVSGFVPQCEIGDLLWKIQAKKTSRCVTAEGGEKSSRAL